MGAMLAQEGPDGVQHAVYYLSKKFLPSEVQSGREDVLDHDMGYKETKALFPVLQNTSCLKDRSTKVFILSTCFDQKNVSMVITLN